MRHLENGGWRRVAQVARNTPHKPAPLPPAPRRGVVWWRSGAWQISEVAQVSWFDRVLVKQSTLCLALPAPAAQPTTHRSPMPGTSVSTDLRISK